uniref:Inosine/uridine-preferring nucleoside hydrolase domain-containing protein n=1 Tax=Chelonoidis abingdonii TaxID=106734 RepID=A0A8C0ILT0_CHEAB
MTKFLLIDVDCGVDDAQAIMMALASPSVEILGITCCYGNTMLENVCKNVLRVLQVCNRLEIPVYQGASAPLLGGPVEGAMYHGRDGLGDVPVPNAPRLDYLQKEHAVIAMLRIVNEKPGQEFYHEWVNQDTKKAKFMKKISEHSIKFTDLKRENTSNILWTSGFVSCDSYAMAAAIDESFVTEAIETAVSVELNGSLTRGMMVMDMA